MATHTHSTPATRGELGERELLAAFHKMTQDQRTNLLTRMRDLASGVSPDLVIPRMLMDWGWSPTAAEAEAARIIAASAAPSLERAQA